MTQKTTFISSPPLSRFSRCSLLLLFSTMSMMKTRIATTRMEVMVTTIFRPPLPDMLPEMGSPVFRSGGMVPGNQHVRRFRWFFKTIEQSCSKQDNEQHLDLLTLPLCLTPHPELLEQDEDH